MQRHIKRIQFQNTDEWLAHRDRIGGSEASAIVGMNPYKTNQELWREKTGRVIPPDISDKPYVKYGHEAEEHIRALFALDFPEYKVEYYENNMFINEKYPFAHASLDGELVDADGRRGILEIKTTNILQSMQREKWNEKIPDNYYIQILWYLMVTEKRCKEIFAECVGDLDRIVSWETIFNPKWLNRTTGEKAIRKEIQAFVDKVDTELKTIGADTSEFVFEMKEEYLKTFDLARAMAVKQELEEAKAKKAVFEAEQKRIEAERQEAIKREAEAVVNAGTEPVMAIELDEDGNPVIVEKEARNLKRVMVTLRVTANETQYPALNTAIKTLREKAEKVELLERKEI